LLKNFCWLPPSCNLTLCSKMKSGRVCFEPGRVFLNPSNAGHARLEFPFRGRESQTHGKKRVGRERPICSRARYASARVDSLHVAASGLDLTSLCVQLRIASTTRRFGCPRSRTLDARFATKTDAEWERTYSNGSVNTAFSTRSQSEPKNSLVTSQRSEVR
jgi:hypothetical protein